jgi:hypothetical protein
VTGGDVPVAPEENEAMKTEERDDDPERTSSEETPGDASAGSLSPHELEIVVGGAGAPHLAVPPNPCLPAVQYFSAGSSKRRT